MIQNHFEYCLTQFSSQYNIFQTLAGIWCHLIFILCNPFLSPCINKSNTSFPLVNSSNVDIAGDKRFIALTVREVFFIPMSRTPVTSHESRVTRTCRWTVRPRGVLERTDVISFRKPSR